MLGVGQHTAAIFCNLLLQQCTQEYFTFTTAGSIMVEEKPVSTPCGKHGYPQVAESPAG